MHVVFKQIPTEIVLCVVKSRADSYCVEHRKRRKVQVNKVTARVSVSLAVTRRGEAGSVSRREALPWFLSWAGARVADIVRPCQAN